MGIEELPVSATEPIDDERYRQGRVVTWVSVGVNLLLTIAQVAGGILTNAQSLVADGIHSLSDLVADFLVLVANFHSRHPADEGHPYGHQRIETVASFMLGLLLVATGAGILWAAAGRVQHLDALPPVSSLALWIALGTLAAKEGLFRYMLRVGERLRSPMLIANAWHARSDAASSLVVAAGITGSLLGYRFLDPVAAVIVGFMIMRMGAVFSWDALRELMDEGIPEQEVTSIRATITATPGVVGLHDLRTRRMAQKILIDAHIQVDGRISVSEGHRIGDQVRKQVLDAHGDVLDMLVHIDPENDKRLAAAIRLPDRQGLLDHLHALMGEVGKVEPEKVQLHYLDGQVEAELIFAATADAEELARLDGLLADRVAGDPYFSRISLLRMMAPK